MMRLMLSIYLTMLLMNWGYGRGLVAQTDSQGTSDETSPPAGQVKPDAGIDELFERQRQSREEGKRRRFDHLATRFMEEFGYNPKSYGLVLEGKKAAISHIAGGSYLRYKFYIEPVEGIIAVQPQTVTIRHNTIGEHFVSTDMDYDNYVTLAVKFTLDPQICRKFSDGSNCTFAGQNSVRLPSFIEHHQILKDGIWEITYLKSGKSIANSFRIPTTVLPEGTHPGVTMNDIETYICRRFPDYSSCQARK